MAPPPAPKHRAHRLFGGSRPGRIVHGQGSQERSRGPIPWGGRSKGAIAAEAGTIAYVPARRRP